MLSTHHLGALDQLLQVIFNFGHKESILLGVVLEEVRVVRLEFGLRREVGILDVQSFGKPFVSLVDGAFLVARNSKRRIQNLN